MNNSIELSYTFKKIINQKNITENSKYNNEKIKVSNIVEGAFKNNFKSGTKTAVKRNRNIELFSKVLYLNYIMLKIILIYYIKKERKIKLIKIK